LRAARERAGLSQAALAEKVGLAPNHVARLEAGEKSNPRFETVGRLASELGLSLDELAAACGYSRKAAFAPKDLAAIAEAASRLTVARASIHTVDSKLSETIASLQQQLHTSAGAKPKRKQRKRP
jgi:transcriptional regulator with XRE-family HTH domain